VGRAHWQVSARNVDDVDAQRERFSPPARIADVFVRGPTPPQE